MTNRASQSTTDLHLTACVSKVHERFANGQLQEFAIQNSLIGNKQFAFKRFSSCRL